MLLELVWTVRHEKLSVPGMTARFESLGLPKDYAVALAGMDDAVANGSENRVTKKVQLITGRQPKSFEQFVTETLSAWTP
mgnify:CR=1 FL=1